MRARLGYLSRMLVLVLVCLGGASCAPSDLPGPDGDPAPVEDITDDPGSFANPRSVGRIRNPAIVESSGLVAARRNPGRFWTHNDSGYGPVIYCLTARGRACGSARVAGAEAFDWEDIAIGPGPTGEEPHLYIGDIGDNLGLRSEIVVYRFTEPEVPEGAGRRTELLTVTAAVLRFTYPGRPRDAESLLVHPVSGDLYVISKERDGRGIVFKANAPLIAGETVRMNRIGRIGMRSLFPGPTGADVASDGRRVVLADYVRAHEAVIPKGGSFDDIWDAEWTSFDLGRVPQREGIAYSLDGRSVLSTSEGHRARIYVAERE